ncbi:MAG TPA: sodium:proton antiporter, partial [Rhodanobacteraceae bacterium]|nr:sodium:proton antiporter [Rhodanobacteraceae bacterium]
LAMSSQREANTLACLHYRAEFGRGRVYRLRNLTPSERSQRAAFSDTLLAPALFGDDTTLSRFTELLEAGWRVRSTALSDSFGWTDFQARHSGQSQLLFALTDKGVLRMASSRHSPEPRAGWTITALTPPAAAAPGDTA